MLTDNIWVFSHRRFGGPGDVNEGQWHGHGAARDVMRGQLRGHDVAVFDFTMDVPASSLRGRRSTKERRDTVVLVNPPSWNTVPFVLRPERLVHKLEVLGYQDDDIDFNDSPRFSSKYLLTSPDVTAVRELFTPKIREHFESKKIAMESYHKGVIFFSPGARLGAGRTTELLNDGLATVELFVGRRASQDVAERR